MYELSAFLEALKSSIDFVSVVIGFHLRGIELDSIRTLIKLVKKGQSGPLLDEIINNLEWLQNLRSYRHHVVHRLIFSIEGGQMEYNVDGISGVANYPIVIPKNPPSYVPDTRESRAWDDSVDSQRGLSKVVTETTMKINQEPKKRTSFKIEFLPSLDNIPIRDFMKQHIFNYETFIVQIIKRLIEINFNLISI